MPNVAIESNHSHDLVIPQDDIELGAPKDYTVVGAHSHVVTVTAEHMAELALGRHIHLTTHISMAHCHAIVVCHL